MLSLAGSDSRLSLATTLMLCTATVSRSSGCAVLITPVWTSMLKQRSGLDVLSMEYLQEEAAVKTGTRGRRARAACT